jgi:hypothetical protein
MLRNIFGRICRNPRGLVAVAGVIGVLTGVERLLRTHTRSGQHRLSRAEPHKRVVAPRQDYFRIRRTKLQVGMRPMKFDAGIRRGGFELGYTYWVLQGLGRHRCFVLCDTWQEAMEEATARLNSASLRAQPERLATVQSFG